MDHDSNSESAPAAGRTARRIRLPGFVTNEEVGLGDVIKRATSIAGIRPCGSCSSRAATLNSLVVFGPSNR